MPSSNSTKLIPKIIGGIIVGFVTFGCLQIFGWWELSTKNEVIIGAMIGLLFTIVGGSVWEWIREIFIWS